MNPKLLESRDKLDAIIDRSGLMTARTLRRCHRPSIIDGKLVVHLLSTGEAIPYADGEFITNNADPVEVMPEVVVEPGMRFMNLRKEEYMVLRATRKSTKAVVMRLESGLRSNLPISLIRQYVVKGGAR